MNKSTYSLLVRFGKEWFFIMKKIISIFMIFIIITESGCGNTEQQDLGITISQTESIENLKLGEISQEYRFNFSNINVYSFTISDIGEIYASTDKINLAKYTGNGELIEEYNNAQNLTALNFNNNKVYGYNYEQNRLDVYDLSSKKQSAVTNKFDVEIIEIKDLVIIKETAYVLVIPMLNYNDEEAHDHYGEHDENGFSDFDERLYKINLTTGEIHDLKIENIISIYSSVNDDLFYYSYENNAYTLNILDLESSNSKKISNMDDVGYIFAFIYENNNFTYIDPSYTLKNKIISNNFISTLEENIYTGPGCNIWLYAGHFVYLDIPFYTIDTAQDEVINAKINSVYIGYLYDNTDFSSKKEEAKTDKLVISDYKYYNTLNAIALRKETGISATVEPIPLDDIVFLTEIMAGNESVDVYIFSSSHYATRILKERGFYVPLNTSKTISGYIDGCFDYLSNTAKTKDNETWAIPLTISTNALWYVPENFEKFNLTHKDVEFFDDFIKTLERLYEQTNSYSDYAVYGFVNNFYPSCYIQYEAVHNDYENNIINFNTDLFKKLVETLYSGWDRQIDPNGNKLFRPSFTDSVFDDRGLSTTPQYDTDRVIFKLEAISDITTDLNKWRILPEPKITSDLKTNLVGVKYAVVNPHSKNKEAAILYLETAVSDPHSFVKDPCFTQKNIEFYNNVYDTSLPAFLDIYDICKNGEVYYNYTPSSEHSYIEDYQQNRLTLDEAVISRQREVEMWLNE